MKIIFKPLFKKYLIYCFKNTFTVGLLIFLEQISIFVSLISILVGIFKEYLNEEVQNFFNNIFKISPIYFIKTTITCRNSTQNNSLTICSVDNFIILAQILITCFIISFLISFILEEILQDHRSEDNIAENVSEKQSINECLTNFITFFFVNFLDFTIHFCSLGIFYLNFNEIFGFLNLLNSNNSTNNSSSSENTYTISLLNVLVFFLCFFFLFFYFYIYVAFIKNINLIIQYNKDLSTHYDHIFSTNFDIMIFFLKILISLESAYENNKIVSEKTIIFLKILIIFIFVIYNFYLILSNLFAKKILYLSNHKYNIFRIYLNNISFYFIIFIVLFNKIFFQNFHVIYLCFFISLIISGFISKIINDKNYIAIYSTDNYILQLIYILNVKYNSNLKELNSEISNIMFYHKNYCIYHKTCCICKMDNFQFENFLLNFFQRIKRIIKSKNLRFSNFSKNDLKTFDIIELLIIENLDKNKIIKLIYKARRILEKYEVKKRYDNNYFNLLIYNNYMKKLITKNQILKFKIIQCYEDTSLHINEALAIVETMLMSLNNGEKHLYSKSSDLFKLKNKISKNILFLSYYQNYFVDTYSIIIFRFIFKNLFNCEINDYVTIYNFEEIKDLINYMYSNEKLIQIKLNFNNNSMKLLRIGKDLMDYKDKCFDDLIPNEFKEHCCSELIKKIKSSENEENKSFEYIISDSENNLKSLKINFSILASFKLDEVILIGQYDILCDDLILLKKNINIIKNISIGLNHGDYGTRSDFMNNITEIHEKNNKENKENVEYDLTNYENNKLKNSIEEKDNITIYKENKKIKTEKNIKNLKNEKKTNQNNFEKYSMELTSNETEIINFSHNLQNILFIKSTWLNKIKKKCNLPFVDIFERIVSQHKKIDEDSDINLFFSIYRINYDKYFLIYQKLINFVEEEMSSQEIKQNLKKFRLINKSNRMSYYKLNFLYEINIKKKDSAYLLYRIKEIKQTDNKELDFNNIEDSLLVSMGENNKPSSDPANSTNMPNEMDYEKLNNILKEKETMSISMSSSAGSGNTSKLDAIMAADTSRKTIDNNDKRMNKFTIFSLIFCIFLVIYCLIFLVLGTTNNNNIRKLFLIRNNFNDFRYFFYHTNMNLFFNIGLFKNEINLFGDNINNNDNLKNNNTKTFINSFFIEKYKKENNITIDVSKYVVEELSIKLNLLRSIYVNLQNAIFSSHYKDSLDIIFNSKINFLQINTIGNKISVSFNEKYFFETINIFFNHGKVIIDNTSGKNYVNLFIINSKNNKVDFGNYSKNFKFTEIQTKMYEILLNYMNFYKNFSEMGNLMNKFFSDSLTDVFNSTYLLSFILMGVHLFLFVGGIMIIQFLYKIISQNDKMLAASNDDENIKFMREKLKYIKNLSLFFVENPRVLVNEINKKRNEYMKKFCLNKDLKNKNKIQKISEEKNNLLYLPETGDISNLKIKDDKSKISYLDKYIILLPFMRLFFVLFFVYYIYSLIFYFIFKNSYNDFILTSEFSNRNLDLDNKIMNNINLLTTMMILNKTEFDLSYDLTGKENPFMMDLLTNILKIRTEISKYKKTNIKFQTIDDYETSLMNCTYIFSTLNDSIFYELEKNQENNNIISSLTSICNSYKFMNSMRIDSIFDEISYNSLHLYNLYDSSEKSYSNITKIFENIMFYDVFLMIIFIFRPIRKFSNDYIYNNIIILSSNNYLVFTIVYLILNIIVDLLIFYIINRMVVKKISDINKHLNNMITCLCFKFSNNNKDRN